MWVINLKPLPPGMLMSFFFTEFWRVERVGVQGVEAERGLCLGQFSSSRIFIPRWISIAILYSHAGHYQVHSHPLYCNILGLIVLFFFFSFSWWNVFPCLLTCCAWTNFCTSPLRGVADAASRDVPTLLLRLRDVTDQPLVCPDTIDHVSELQLL